MILRSLLSIARIHVFPIRSIEFVLALTQDEPDVYVFMEIPLGVLVDGNRVKWVLKLKESLYRLKQASANWFDPLNMV